jgi:hypothetical protein
VYCSEMNTPRAVDETGKNLACQFWFGEHAEKGESANHAKWRHFLQAVYKMKFKLLATLQKT